VWVIWEGGWRGGGEVGWVGAPIGQVRWDTLVGTVKCVWGDYFFLCGGNGL